MENRAADALRAARNCAKRQGLRELLTSALGIKTIVKKTREIWYIENVKFHIDEVPGLGSFMEIEAGNMLGHFSRDQLKAQCDDLNRRADEEAGVQRKSDDASELTKGLNDLTNEEEAWKKKYF